MAQVAEAYGVSVRDLYETDDRNYLIYVAEVVDRVIWLRKEMNRQSSS